MSNRKPALPRRQHPAAPPAAAPAPPKAAAATASPPTSPSAGSSSTARRNDPNYVQLNATVRKTLRTRLRKVVAADEAVPYSDHVDRALERYLDELGA